MAANINYNERTKRYSFVSKKELAWHKLGTIVEAMTSEEAMVLGGLDYKVELTPLIIKGKRLTRKEALVTGDVIKEVDPIGTLPIYYEEVIKAKTFVTKRSDNHYPLGVVGSRYPVIQNIEAFPFFDKVIG